MINQAQILSALRDEDQLAAITELLADAWTEGAESDDKYEQRYTAWADDLDDHSHEPMPPTNPYQVPS